MTAIELLVEIELDGVWTDVTEYTYTRDGITITRGRMDEAAGTEPSVCSLTLNNRDGRFSPRNPRGPYYGVLGRNTPLRVRVALAGAWHTRFVGEVSSWPARWDVDEVDVWVSVEASGVSRRIGQGASPLDSALKRGIRGNSDLVAYWPMEDIEGSTSFASALTGNRPLSILIPTGAEGPAFGAESRFDGSLPLPSLNGGIASATVPAHTAGGSIAARFVCVVPATTPSGTSLLRFTTTGVARTWELTYLTSGSGDIRVDAKEADGTSLLSTVTSASLNDRVAFVDFKLTQDGPDIDWELVVVDVLTDAGFIAGSGTVVATNHGGVSRVIVNGSGTMGDAVIGHLHFLRELDSNPYSFEKYVRGYIPESAGRRVERLCTEEGVTYVPFYDLGPASPDQYGDLAGFTAMGPQQPKTLSELLAECAATDLGILIEPRDAIGYTYRPRSSLYSQLPVLELSYDSVGELSPVDDDQATRNDVTVSSTRGSSARSTLDSGTLSTLQPPLGVGRYDTSFEVNLENDADLAGHASWRLHLGTVDETRYPIIKVELAAPAFSADPDLTAAVLTIDQGDLITIDGLPSWLPPDLVRQLAQGFTEEISPYGYAVTINCTPASPWDALVEGAEDYSRVDSEVTTLAEDLDTTETGVDVAVAAGGALWITTATHPTEFPFDVIVGGEVMTVQACSGTSSPQTFTVTRSVNGIVKTHSAGASVRLARPVFAAL